MDVDNLGAAAVVLDSAGRVLLVKHTYGRLNWELPGGRAHDQESAEETALRELFEETGMTALASRLTGIYYEPEIDMHHFVFVCRATGSNEPKPADTEISECAYWPIEALPRPISDFTIRRIEDALNQTPISLVIVPIRHWLE